MPSDIPSNIALGVLGSFIASVLFLAALFARRPNLAISEEISKTALKCRTVYCIKVVNRGWFDCINVQAELVLVQPDRMPGGGVANRINPIPLLKNSIFVLRSRRTTQNQSATAFRFTTSADLESTWRRQEASWKQHHAGEPELRPYVHIVVYAQDGLSNFGRVFDRAYSSVFRDLQTGEFEHGRSLTISSIPSDRGDA
jgi:hypothetical protein